MINQLGYDIICFNFNDVDSNYAKQIQYTLTEMVNIKLLINKALSICAIFLGAEKLFHAENSQNLIEELKDALDTNKNYK